MHNQSSKTLYIDFNGVITTNGSEGAKEVTFKNLVTKEFNGRTKLYRPENIEKLNNFLKNHPDLTLVWVTTWGVNDDVKRACTTLGLDLSLPKEVRIIQPEYVDSEISRERSKWKAKGIIRDQRRAGEGKYIWIDDGASKEWGAEVEGNCKNPGKAITTGLHGITEDEINEIEKWLFGSSPVPTLKSSKEHLEALKKLKKSAEKQHS